MASDDERHGDSPRAKRHKSSGDSSPRRDGENGDVDQSATRKLSIRENRRNSRTVSPSPGQDGAGESRYESRRTSRSRSRLRSQSISSKRSDSRLRSRSPSRITSRTRSPRSSRSRSRSQSSSRHAPIDSLSPPEAESSPSQEPFKPNYKTHLVLRGHSKPVSQVRISPNGRFIASASADATVKIWDATTGEHMDTLVGHMAGVSCLAWTPDSNTIASGSDDKAIRLWDRVTGRPKTTTRKSVAGQDMAPLKGHHNYIHCLAFSPKGNILASGSYDEAVFLWDSRRNAGRQCLRTLVHEDNPAVANVCFAPNGRFVLAFNLDNCIRLWDYVSGTVKKTYQGHINDKFAVGGCFGVLGGAPFIVSASEDGSIVMWDVVSKTVLQRVEGHKGVCFWVDVHGETMVTAGQDCTVKVYRHIRDAPKANGEVSKVEKEPKPEAPKAQEDVVMEDA
ncbi:hypothetical protein HG531_002409 [Fusarium graminearum]|nr:hypothetical protein HG531_002409 [Fusarium graminearum]